MVKCGGLEKETMHCNARTVEPVSILKKEPSSFLESTRKSLKKSVSFKFCKAVALFAPSRPSPRSVPKRFFEASAGDESPERKVPHKENTFMNSPYYLAFQSTLSGFPGNQFSPLSSL